MDLQKTGLFIAELRKQQGMTQKELAQILGVSDKAVSRWETGKGLPDTALLRPLCQQLGVCVEELLAGERITYPVQEKTDEILVQTLDYARTTVAQTLRILLFCLALMLTLSPLYLLGSSCWPVGVALLLLTLLLELCCRGVGSRWLPRLSMAAGLMISLLLEIIPGGAVLIFAVGPEERLVRTFCYFSLIPLGYGNMAPMLTAVLTLAALLLRGTGLLFPRLERPNRWGSICTLLALVCSCLPTLLFGSQYMNVQSWAVTGALAVAAFLQLWVIGKR